MTALECMGCAIQFDAPQGAPCPECGTTRDVWALDETAGRSCDGCNAEAGEPCRWGCLSRS